LPLTARKTRRIAEADDESPTVPTHLLLRFGVRHRGRRAVGDHAEESVHAVLALVLTFFSTACLWMLADAEFLALALIVVYVGAVMVLFLFVVMMLDIDQEKMREGFVKFLPIGLIVAMAMLVEMLGLIGVRRCTRR
jgi:hypothetical protein